MPHTQERRGRGRELIAAVAVTGAAAGIALSAVPTVATAAPRAAAAQHHHTSAHHVVRHVRVVGLVTAHHRRSMTVFARTARAGSTVRHNQRLQIRFAPHVHARTRVPLGDVVHLRGLGRLTHHRLMLVHRSHESVDSSEATLLFGTISAINGNELLVSEHARDDGDSEDGNDSQGGGDSSGSGDLVTSRSRGSDDGDSHVITVDDSTATIIVDNGSNPLAVGDTVAILGEVTDNTVVAEAIFGFSTRPAFLRGDVVSVAGSSVTVSTGDDGQDGEGSGSGPADGGWEGDGGSTQTFDLSDVPVALNGSSARASDLVAGDKIIVIGPTNPETGQIIPEVVFAFNGHDDGPVGDNGGGQGED